MTEPTKKENDEKLSSEDYENLLDRYQFSTKEITPGKILKGRVIKTTPTHILVDIGFKTEGMIPSEEFYDPSVMANYKPGDEIDTVLERTDLKDGYLVLSKKAADEIRAVDDLDEAYRNQTEISGIVIGRTRGGFSVNVGITAFLPESHADIRPVRDPDSLLGKTFKFRVVKFDRKGENAVVSRRLILQDERDKKKKEVFGSLAKGQKIMGTVRSITNFGAFIDIGGIEGLLHITDISWGKLTNPAEALKTGQQVEVMVLDFNDKTEKISLGLKQLRPDPWENVGEKYTAGQRIKGKVSSLVDFGAFVELEPGVEGLVHVSDLSWSRKAVHPKKVLSLGQEVEVAILDVNQSTRRISLGLKQVTPHPLEVFRQNHTVGSRVTGKVMNITDFGAFVEVEPGIEGLVHVSDMSWEKVKNPAEVLTIGQEVEVVILNIDVERQKISLGIKQLEGDIWGDFCGSHRPGECIKVKIARMADFGVFVEIQKGIEGVVFSSELDEKKIEKPSDSFQVGEEKVAKILRLDARTHKISLSFKQAQFDMQKKEFQKYMDSQEPKMTFGDLLKEQLKNINAPKRTDKKE